MPFERFDASHLAALLATFALGAALAAAVKRSSDRRLHALVRGGLVVVLLGLTVVFLVVAASDGELDWYEWVPLQLCDVAIFLAVYALLTRHPLAYELLYFWGGAGTLIAMITPDVRTDFPSWEFIFFFALHGAVVATLLVLTFGFGLRPRPGAAGRAFLITNAYAAVVAVINVATGSNFLYLRAKPQAGSILDWFGPWPYYILGAEVLAIALFWALEAPFRASRRRLG